MHALVVHNVHRIQEDTISHNNILLLQHPLTITAMKSAKRRRAVHPGSEKVEPGTDRSSLSPPTVLRHQPINAP
eukprot:6250796-Pyramimonas_sp.AAC.1